MKLGKQLWTILYINFPKSYSYIWLIWKILHEWYRSSIGTWAALDILQIQRIEQDETSKQTMVIDKQTMVIDTALQLLKSFGWNGVAFAIHHERDVR